MRAKASNGRRLALALLTAVVLGCAAPATPVLGGPATAIAGEGGGGQGGP